MRVQHERAQTGGWLVSTWDTSGVTSSGPRCGYSAHREPEGTSGMCRRRGRSTVTGTAWAARRGAYTVQLAGRDRRVASDSGGLLRVVCIAESRGELENNGGCALRRI